MINTITAALKDIFGFKKSISEKEIECAIDENIVECTEMEEELFTGIPAPVYLKEDPWFGPTPNLSEKQKDYMAVEMEWKIEEEKKREESGAEPDDIHQVMYEMATKSGATTVQLDPIGGSENFQGGSENVHR
jgi:hypothetical protein